MRYMPFELRHITSGIDMPPLPGGPTKPARQYAKGILRKALGLAGKMNLFIFRSDPRLFLCPGVALQPIKHQARASLLGFVPSFAGMGPGGVPPGAELEAAEASKSEGPPVQL